MTDRHSSAAVVNPKWPLPLTPKQLEKAEKSLISDATGARGLLAAASALSARGIEHSILIPEALMLRLEAHRHRMAESLAVAGQRTSRSTRLTQIASLLELPQLCVVPKGQYDDLFVIADALRRDGCILSNDRMSDTIAAAVSRRSGTIPTGADSFARRGLPSRRSSKKRQGKKLRTVARTWMAQHRIPFVFMRIARRAADASAGAPRQLERS